MTGRDPAHAEARGRDLRRTTIGVIAIVGWIVLAGVLWRQVPDPPERGELSIAAGLDRSAIIVEPGMTVGELGQLLEELGLDTEERTADFASSPDRLDLPDDLIGLDHLDGYLAPGRYAITPTSDAPTLLTRMARAFVEQLTDPVRAEIGASGLSLAEVVHVAGLAQEGASTTAELPVVAGVVRNQAGGTDRELGAVGSEALAAALQPITTTASDYHHAADGTVRLGPEPVGGTGAGATAPTELERLAASLFEPLGARTATYVVGIEDGAVLLDQGSRRFMETASVYKLAVVAVIMDEVDAGRLTLDEPVATQLPRTGDQGTAEPLEPQVTLREALRRTIEISDNPSAEALLFGLGSDVINRRLRSWGIQEFNVGSQPQVATPHGIAQLLDLMAGGTHHSEESVEQMFTWLEATRQDDRLPRLIPGLGPIPHKVGDLDRVVNDAGIIPSPIGPLVIVALVEEVDDRLAASNAIAGLAQLMNSWLTRYLDAQAAVAEGTAEGCELVPSAPGPLTGARIALDAAHGGENDPGTRVTTTQGGAIVEAEVTLRHVEILAEALAEQGARILFTRCEKGAVGAATRAAIVNAWEADLLVSIDHRAPRDAAPDNEALVGYFRSDSEPWAAAFTDEDRVISAWPEPSDPEVGIAANVVVRPSVLLHLTLMPGITIGPGDLVHGPEADAVGDAMAGDGSRLEDLAAITAGRITSGWQLAQTGTTDDAGS